ncbi:hypothetical protein [Emticicia sp. BO119]|uniref:hypothetical protein n=1 Tax=Emticicia sp. BO119 TaxID=2757768 RepID=UPI0015F03FD8|nr:hypothetical protein [Emticicia sp. BO119]MBA4849043.1 hypothetical protein [Emticicia sp. BO119]
MALHDNIQYHPTNQHANTIVGNYIDRIEEDILYIVKGADFKEISITGNVVVENNAIFVKHLTRISPVEVDEEIADYLIKSQYISALLKGINLE